MKLWWNWLIFKTKILLFQNPIKTKLRPKTDQLSNDASTGIGSTLKSIVNVAILMLLMMFAVHCTWVSSLS